MSLDGLSIINIELTDLCNKNCWMCSRRTAPASTEYGDMDFLLVQWIAKQLPSNIAVQFHANGESLLYPEFSEVMDLFERQIRCITTNGKLLIEKADEIILLVDTLSISIFEGDTEAVEQLEIIKEFLRIKGIRRPFTNLKLIGNVDEVPYKSLGAPLIYRQMHKEDSSWYYTTKAPTIPEIGVCWDFLSHPCIHRNGDVSICVRYDPLGLGILGNLNRETMNEIWNGEKRLKWLELHKWGGRSEIPLCSRCNYWGIPTV